MNCKKGAALLLQQIVDLISVIDPEDFKRPLDLYNDSTIGKHFRHIYDFFNCLILSADIDAVDYCMRDRNPLIEEDRDYCRSAFNQLKEDIFQLDEDVNVMVYADFEMEGHYRPVVKTSIGREIMYAYDHAVHHLAIVKIGLKSIKPDLAIDENMGVAASTIRHRHAH